MKAILSFRMPEDNDEYLMHCNGPKYSVMMWELGEEYLRPIYKYNKSAELVKQYKTEMQSYNTPVMAQDEEIAQVLEWFAQELRKKISELEEDNNIVSV